jgi:hypothetical protein
LRCGGKILERVAKTIAAMFQIAFGMDGIPEAKQPGSQYVSYGEPYETPMGAANGAEFF